LIDDFSGLFTATKVLVWNKRVNSQFWLFGMTNFGYKIRNYEL